MTALRRALSGAVTTALALSAVAGSAGALTALATPATAAPAAHGPAAHAPVSSRAGSYLVRGASARAAVLAAGGRVTRALPLVGGVAAQLPAGAAARVAATAGVTAVDADSAVTLMSTGPYVASSDSYSLKNLEDAVGARTLWAHGFTGKGVDVAVLDSGVTPVAGLNASGKVVDGPDLTEESQNAATAHLDAYGHGTHMAGIIAGHDAAVADATQAAGNTTDFLGVAPDARILNVKAGDAMGATDVSQVIAALDWIVQHKDDNGLHVRVVNLSFGTDSTESYVDSPLDYAVEQAWRAGLFVSVSAGNNGTGANRGTMTSPADDPFVMAVGAEDTAGTPLSYGDDTSPDFSAAGGGARRPDVVAPGVHVVSLRVPGSHIDAQYGSTGQLGDRFFRGSGTSQAAAVVSGAAALLLQKYPTLTPDALKGILTNNAVQLNNVSENRQGRGLIQLAPALTSTAGSSYTPSFTRSTGTGTLEGARGSKHLVLNGVTLTGEQDIMGKPFDSAAHAQLQATSSAWQGGTWNGATWSGATWSGATWSGATWSGATWSGATWSGATWSAGTWNGATWSGMTWGGATWSGATWSGATWSGATWSDNAWS